MSDQAATMTAECQVFHLAPVLQVKIRDTSYPKLEKWANEIAAGDDMGDSLVVLDIYDRASGVAGVGVGFNSRKAGMPLIVWPWEGGDNQGRVFFSINPIVTDFEHLWWATQLAVDTIMGINYDYFLGLEDEALECWSEQIWKGETQTGGD